MKILIVATGGTIGSFEKDNIVNLNSDKSLPVVDKYMSEYGNVDFEIINPLNILSENISKEDFINLFITLSKIEYTKYDGIIVTSGSDNLSYISAYISLLFSSKNVPIYIVATNMVLSDERSNGYSNFVSAVKCISEGKKGVFVPWKNSDGSINIYEASTILPVDINGNLYSFGKKLELNHNYDLDNLPTFNNVLMINPYPLCDYENYELSKVDYVLHNTYHSGTADTEKLLEFLKKCDGKNVKIYLTGLLKGQRIYSSAQKLIDANIISAYDVAYPALYMYLLLFKD